ncbi:MAG: YdeI/OmpD-associated family protein [Pseudomonadota bacterium]
MPEDVCAALQAEGLQSRYDARRWYQRNDDLGWVGRAKRPETRQKRLRPMLDALAKGDVNMKVMWRGKNDLG